MCRPCSTGRYSWDPPQAEDRCFQQPGEQWHRQLKRVPHHPVLLAVFSPIAASKPGGGEQGSTQWRVPNRPQALIPCHCLQVAHPSVRSQHHRQSQDCYTCNGTLLSTSVQLRGLSHIPKHVIRAIFSIPFDLGRSSSSRLISCSFQATLPLRIV